MSKVRLRFGSTGSIVIQGLESGEWFFRSRLRKEWFTEHHLANVTDVVRLKCEKSLASTGSNSTHRCHQDSYTLGVVPTSLKWYTEGYTDISRKNYSGYPPNVSGFISSHTCTAFCVKFWLSGCGPQLTGKFSLLLVNKTGILIVNSIRTEIGS